MKKEDLINLGIDETVSEMVLQLSNQEMQGYMAITDFDKEIEKLRTKIDEGKKNSAVDMAILKAKGRNIKAIRALIDMNKVEVGDNGVIIKGFDIDALKKSDPYLFETEERKIEGTGITSGVRTNQIESMRTQFENAVNRK